MDRLAGLDKYFKEKDRKKLDKIASENGRMGMPTMTKDEIRQSCVENGGYETPELNDKLYLHFRGFKKIENLEAYANCKAIWLDSNGLDTIEGLDALVELRCLYMSKNLINKIQNISHLKELVQLDLSNNRITNLEGLSGLPNLDSINLSRNALTSPESISHLAQCPSLRTVDLQNNRLESNENFIQVFQSIPSLATLSINGNEITKIQSFRKKMIHSIPKLGYLDRPIEESERLAVAAFMIGGLDAEKEAREQWRIKQSQERQEQMTAFREWQAEQQKLRQNMPAEQRSRIEVEDSERAARREASAVENADMERRALQEVGIQKIAVRVAELEAQGCGGNNVVNLAQRELLQELDDQRRVVELDDNGLPLPPAPEASTNFDELDDDEDSPPRPPAKTRAPLSGSVPGYENFRGTLSKPAYSVASSADEGRQYPEHSNWRVPEDHVESEPATVEEPVESPEDVSARIDAEEEAAKKELEAKKAAEEEAAAKKKAQAEEFERQERVAASLAMYKAQKAAAQKKAEQPVGNSKPIQSSWDAAIAPEAPVPVVSSAEPRVVLLDAQEQPVQIAGTSLYWSEDMDIILAKQVQACIFDFDGVSREMIQRFSKAQLTPEACRLRWADLDAGNTGHNALETNFTCYVSENVITKGHGAQPTFDALSSLARGQFPTYLKAPSAFPSVADLSDDESDSEDKENGKRAVVIALN